MRFGFKSDKLEGLYVSEAGASKYPSEVVESFFAAMDFIKFAHDERELYTLKSFHFEKLQGERRKQGDRSLRLNRQWRLIVRIERDERGKYILIIDIEKHYND